MSGFNAILFTDTSQHPMWMRGYGAHRLANHLRNNGYSCLVIDYSSGLNFETWKKICYLAIDSNTLILGFSTTWWPYRSIQQKKVIANLYDFGKNEQDYDYTYLKNGLTEAAAKGNLDSWINEAKKFSSDLKVLVGGPKIDFYKDIPADHFMVGFSETQILDYLCSLRTKKRLWPKYIDHDTKSLGMNFDFKSSQTFYTQYDIIRPDDVFTIEFTRGCKFKCAFCSYPMIGRKNVVEESLKYQKVIYEELKKNYEEWGVTKYWIADDTFNDSTEKLENILSAIELLNFKPQFKAYTRLDVLAVQPNQAQILKDIGLVNTWMGIDSMHPVASKVIGKGMSYEKKKEALYKIGEIWKNDIIVKAGYIVGLPGEDSQYVKNVVDWFISDECPVHEINLNPLRILPPHENFLYTMRSDIDKNFKSYGYNIKDLNRFWEWTKDDGTDIKDFLTAAKLCFELTKKIQSMKKYEENFDQITFNDPQQEYFDLLIEKLESRK